MSETTLTARILAQDEASDAFKQVGRAAQQMGQDVSSAGSQMSGAAKDISNVGGAAKQASGETKSFGTSMASLGFGVASVASGIVGFARSLENVSRAQDKATALQTRYLQATANVEKAQRTLSEAVAKYGSNSQQAADASAKLDLMLRKQADAGARAANAAENVGFAMSNAAIDVIQFGAGIGQIASTLAQFKGAGAGIVSALSGLGSAFTGAASGAKGLGQDMASLGPAFSGFSTNAGNSVGIIGKLKAAFTGLTGIGAASTGISSLGGALGNFTTDAGGAVGAIGKLTPALSKLGTAAAIAFGAFATADTALKFFDELESLNVGNLEKASKALDGIWQNIQKFNIIGPDIPFLAKLAGFDTAKIAKLSEGLTSVGKSAKDAGQGAESGSEGFGTLGEAVTDFASQSKAASSEAPKLFDEIIKGANKAGIAIESISGADIKDIFGKLAEGAAPAAQTVDLVAQAFDAYAKAATDGKQATDPMAAAQQALSGSMESVGKSTRQATSDLGQLQSQYFSTLHQIKEGAAIGPGGVVGSREALERMGIPSSQIFEGAAAERALAFQKGFEPPPTLKPKTDNTALNQGIEDAKTKSNEITATPKTVKIGADKTLFDQIWDGLKGLVPPSIKVGIGADETILGAALDGLKNLILPQKDVPLGADETILGNAIAGIQNLILPQKDVPIGANETILGTAIQALTNLILPQKDVPIGANESILGTAIQGLQNLLLPQKDVPIGANETILGNALTALTNLILPQKDVPIGANTSVLGQVLSGIQTSTLPQKDVPIGGDKSLFDTVISGIETQAMPSKSVTVSADKSVFDAAIEDIKTKLSGLTDSVAWKALFGSAGGGGGGRHGLTQVVSRPSNIRVGEGFAPELVTVIPLGKSGGNGAANSLHAREGGSFASAGLTQAPTGFPIHMASGGAIFASAMAAYVKALAEWAKSIAKATRMIIDANTVSTSLLGVSSVFQNPRYNPNLKGAVSEKQDQVREIERATRKQLADLSAKRPEAPKPPSARHGGSFLVDEPTTLNMRAGGSLVNVAPLGRGGGASDERLDRLLSAVEKLARRNQATEANLVVDGQRMATVAEKYMGSKSYGGR